MGQQHPEVRSEQRRSGHRLAMHVLDPLSHLNHVTPSFFFTLSHAISECCSLVEHQLFPAPSAPASAIPLEHQHCRRPNSGRLRLYSVPSGWSEPSAASSLTFITRLRIEPGESPRRRNTTGTSMILSLYKEIWRISTCLVNAKRTSLNCREMSVVS